MKTPSLYHLKRHNINPANLTEKELKRVLLSFGKAKQMARVIAGINATAGMLTHTISGKLYCNNVSDIRQKSGERLLKHGLKLVCIPQIEVNPLTKSFHWYLCRVGEVEYFDTAINPANEGGLI